MKVKKMELKYKQQKVKEIQEFRNLKVREETEISLEKI
jgi:hypothetical protein